MTIPIRQSTADQKIPLGYFLDKTNGDDEETGLTIANTDIKLWKHGSTTVVSKNSGGATHIANGLYYCTLDATDSNTLGGLEIFSHVAGALAIKVECRVYPANEFDSLVLGTDVLEVNMTQCGGSAVAAGAIPNAAADAAGGLPISDVGGLDLDTKLANTNEITAARMGALTDWLNGERLDLILDIIAADTTTDIPAKLLKYAQLLVRSDAAIATDNATELTAINADGGSGAGDFSNQTDGQEAIRDKQTDIETDTAEIGTAGASLTDLGGMSTGMKAEVESEANDALVAQKLDHLVAVADADDAVNDSIVAKMAASDGDWSGFDNATDSLEAIRDRGDAEWATATGFSTHAAADIWSVGTRALTDKSGFALSAAGANLILKDSTFALAMADAIWDEILSGATHNIASSAGRRVREVGAYAIESGTAQAGTSTTITLATTANGTDGVFNRNLIVVTDNTGKGQTRTIVDYNSTSKVCLIDREWRVTPDATTAYQIVADDTPLVVDHGSAQAGTSNTITLRDYASAITDTYFGGVIAIMSGTGRGQSRLIIAYNGTTKVVTVNENWTTTPDTTSIYALMPYGASIACRMCDSALAQIKTECETALTDYDVPTRTEATSDKDAIITEVDANETKIDALQTDSTAIKAKTDNLPSGMAKNVAVPKFDIFMVLSADHVTGATGKTVTGTISKDGGSFTALTNTITEVSNGVYTIANGLTQAERNADVSTFKFIADDCDDRIITIISS